MIVFLTGASGFIGGHILDLLLKRGHNVRVLVRRKMALDQSVDQIVGDLLNPISYSTCLAGCDVIIHAAALVALDEQKAQDTLEINYHATQVLLDAAYLKGIRHFVFLSSAGVFQATGNKPATDDELKINYNNTTYYHSKILAGELVKAFRSDRNSSIILYPTRVYGPGLLTNGNQIARMLLKFSRGKWHLGAPQGSRIGNYVFVEDVALATVNSAERIGMNAEFLIAGDNVSYDTLFETMRFVTGASPFLIKPSPCMLNSIIALNKIVGRFFPALKGNLNGEVTSRLLRDYNYDGSKARTTLNYNATSLTDGMLQTLNSFHLNDKSHGK